MSCFTDMRVSSPTLEQKLDDIGQILLNQPVPPPSETDWSVFEKKPWNEDEINWMRELLRQRIDADFRELYADTTITEEELLVLIDEQVEIELLQDVERYFLPMESSLADDVLTPYHPYIIGALALGVVGAYILGKGGKA